MNRRGLFALAASLAVHVAVLLSVLRDEPSAVAAPPAAPHPVKLVWVNADPPKPPPPPPPRPPPTAIVVRPRPKKPVALEAPITAPPGPDSPRLVELTPSGGDAPMSSAPEAGGRTLVPSELPGEAELRAEETERVSARVGSWLGSDLSAARVRGGLPDPSYGQFGADLRAATDEVPRFIDTNSPKEVLGALAESWGAGAERYGKTGAPYAEPEGRLESVERPSQMAEGAMRGNPDMQAMAQLLAAGARLQEFADGRAGLELFALVEVRQQPSGALETVSLIRPSGLGPFDAWVTERARHVGLSFSFDAGTRARPLRSVWRFDGIVTYRRKLSGAKLDGRAAIGMITMAALSMLSGLENNYPPSAPGQAPGRPLGPRMPALAGRFDELTGEMDVIDLTNPTYDCRVTLVEAD